MITIYDAKATDFSSNGLGVLAPLSCKVSRELNKSYQVELVHARDEAGKWRLLAYERILRVPVPEDKTPALSLSGTTVHEVWKVATNGSRLHMRSGPGLSAKIIGKYANGTRVTLVEKTNSSWYRVTGPDGRTGYMSTDWLTGPVGQQEMPGGEDIEIQSKQVRDQPFRIYKIAYTADTVTAYARHLFFDLADDPVLSLKLTQASGQNALKQIFDAAHVEHEFVPYTDITDTADMEISQKMVSEALLGDGGFVDTYGGEAMFDWYDVYVMQALGEDRGVAIRRGKDLTSMKGEDSVDGMVTRVIPIGKDKNGNDLFLPGDIAVKSGQEGQYAVKRTRVLRVNDARVGKNQNAEAAYEKMRKAAEEMLADGADAPESTLNVGFVDLTRSAFASGQGVQPKLYVGDTVTVIDDVLGLNARQRVQAYTFDALSERYLSVTLGDEAPTTFAPAITRRQLPDQIISGEMLAPGAVDAGALQDGSVSGDKVQEGAIEEKHLGAGAVSAQAIEALRGKIQELVSGSLTTDALYAGIASIALAQITTANIANANIDWAGIASLSADVAEIAKAHLSDADIGWADIASLSAAVAGIAEAKIADAAITAAQIDDLSVTVASILHAEAATGEFTLAEAKNLLADALVLEAGSAGSMSIKNLLVTQANLLGAVIGKLVLPGADGKYYEIVVGTDGALSTAEVPVSAGEAAAGEMDDGRQIVATAINAGTINGSTVSAQQAVLDSILTQALTAGQVTAGQALIASATIPTLYTQSIEAIGNSLTFSANGQIQLIIGNVSQAQAAADAAQENVDALAGGLEAVDAELEDVRGLVLTPDEIQSTVFGATEYQALSSQVSQTAEGLAITQNTVTDIGGRVENLESGVRVGADGIDIYRSGSAYRMHIDNAGWAITGDGQETIAARESKMFAPRVQVNDALIVGRTAWKAAGDGFSRWLKY